MFICKSVPSFNNKMSLRPCLLSVIGLCLAVAYECPLGYFGKGCTEHCSGHCIKGEPCDHISGECTNGCQDGYTGVRCSDSYDAIFTPSGNVCRATVGVAVGTCVLLITGVIVAVFVIRLKRRAKKITKNDRFQNAHVDATIVYSEVSYEKTEKSPPSNKNIPVRNLKDHIANLSSNDCAGFKSEYEDIPRGEFHPCWEAKKPENISKNRFLSIYPYDHSRVILKTPSSDKSDYIHANYIEDARGKRVYIATQNPKRGSIFDFWNMIWQEEVYNIVYLFNLQDGHRIRVDYYWPDVSKELKGGTLIIKHIKETTYAEYTVRQLKIHNQTTRADRHVTIFNYTAPSYQEAPDPLSLVLFHRHVMKATANTAGRYTVVHCSSGVGRTGTYIALDALYREGEKTGKINVPMYVRTMRKDRMNMIHSDEQYKLLYHALMEAFSGPSRCMATEKFVEAYQEQTCHANCRDVVQNISQSSEFEELQSLRKEYTQQDHISGRAQIPAYYTQSVLPVEKFMCCLFYIKGYNSYYNAVLIQTPSWFPTENRSKLNGLYVFKNISSTQASNVRITNLNIQKQGFIETDGCITVIDCPTWEEGKGTTDKRVLLDVIKAVKTEKSDQEGCIIVLSSDGATRCGPFCVVYNVLEQISVDREVDIFTTTRQLQVRRPEFVSTLDEYQLCHDAVAEYLINDRVMETVTCKEKK
ncbi:receptor-type tyrosine-protein phosphatase epsilon isoform X3 [Magallana gigas]|uniref:receptor-type tyrosine-protein phosphatase epsilon isoform X3 n=1 Tax=Magallana gigas TaxID=29159 RepID=UPI0033415247